jgi:IclR family acetate operon transcriptional repressor
MTTLEERRFVQFHQVDGTWHVGRQTFAVGASFVRQRNVVAQALPFLRQLRDLTRETANLGIVEDAEMVVLTQVESREIMRAITRVGGRVPMLASGMGKAMLSTYAGPDVAALIARKGLAPLTHATITTAANLSRQLEDARRLGYAIDDEEYVPGLRCVAAPVLGHEGDAVCAVSVSGLPTRLVKDRIPQLGQCVARIAAELTQALGGTPRAWQQ